MLAVIAITSACISAAGSSAREANATIAMPVPAAILGSTNALFMVPRTPLQLSRAIGDARYACFAREEVPPVVAGLAPILQELPSGDPRRVFYLGPVRDMAERIVALQKLDGYRAPSLSDNGPDTSPKTSGTAFFIYALARGAVTGNLPRLYRPAALRGWTALKRSVQSNSMLGWVQQVGDSPDRVSARDMQFYETRAFILAGRSLYDLAKHEAAK